MIFAELGLLETLLQAVRIVAAVGGALVGWFLIDPFARIVHRAVSLKPISRKALLPIKVLGAGLLGMLIYFFIPLGGGDGIGWGPGTGGGLGKGAGDLGDAKKAEKDKLAKKDADTKKDDVKKAVAVRVPLEIEIISAKNYQMDGRFYLIKRAAPALSLEQVQAYFDKNHEKIELHIIQTPDSVGTQVGALDKLRDTASHHRIPTLERTLEVK